jgi:hypothetical protein
MSGTRAFLAAVALGCLLLGAPGRAAAQEVGRFGLQLGSSILVPQPADVDLAGFHFGFEAAWNIKWHIGPIVSIDITRYGATPETMWTASGGAGLRFFETVPYLKPLAFYMTAQAVVLGSTHPIKGLEEIGFGNAPLGRSFVGPCGEFGLEWASGAVNYAVTGRAMMLVAGVNVVSVSLVLGFFSP